MKIFKIILFSIVFVLISLSLYFTGMKDGIKAFKESDEYFNNIIDMREVVDFEASDSGLYIYMADGNGYYWGE